MLPMAIRLLLLSFQHTAARRRLGGTGAADNLKSNVSTHSRPKAAGKPLLARGKDFLVSTHSRPKAAGSITPVTAGDGGVSTHSRPKAAGPP